MKARNSSGRGAQRQENVGNEACLFLNPEHHWPQIFETSSNAGTGKLEMGASLMVTALDDCVDS
jgi:hypothetical protein